MTIARFFEVAGDSVSHGRDNHREHERRFQIETPHNLPPVTDADLLLGEIYRQHPRLRPFSVHPTRRNSYVTQPRLNRESRWLWELTVPYSTEIDLDELEVKERGNDENPLNEPVDVTLTTRLQTVIVTEDRDGNPIANKAGDPFPDVEDQEVWLEFSFEKNIAKAKREWFLDYPNTVNEEAIKILGIPFEPETLWVQDLRLGKKAIGKDGTRYWPMHTKLVYRKKGWHTKRLNTGTRERQAITTRISATFSPIDGYKLKPIRDDQGEAVDEPVFLDDRGRAYRVDVDPEKDIFTDSDFKQPLRTELEKDAIIKLEFNIKDALPFKDLPIK